MFSITSLHIVVEMPTLSVHSSEGKGSKSEAWKSKKEVVTKSLQWHPRCLSLNRTSVRLLEESWAHHFYLSHVKVNVHWKTMAVFTCLRSNIETDKNL